MEDVAGIIAVFGTIPIIVWIVSHYRTKAKAKTVELVKIMVDKDREVTPELIKSIGFSPSRTHKDLRTGLILLAAGIAFFIFGGNIPNDHDATQIIGGIAMFPILIGVSFLIFWYFVSRKDEI
jgi:uncharacterized protein YqhQ